MADLIAPDFAAQTDWAVTPDWLFAHLDHPQVVVIDCRFSLAAPTAGAYRVHTSPPRLDLRIFRTLPSMDNPILIHAQQVGRIAFGDPRLVKRGPICMTPSLSIKR
jgi:hypothetical protein